MKKIIKLTLVSISVLFLTACFNEPVKTELTETDIAPHSSK